MKSLAEMSDIEALACIEQMSADHLARLKESGETLQDFYSPCEDWIPILARQLRKKYTPPEVQLLKREDIEPGDYLIARCPAEDMNDVLRSLHYCFKDCPKLRVIGVPEGMSLELWKRKDEAP